MEVQATEINSNGAIEWIVENERKLHPKKPALTLLQQWLKSEGVVFNVFLGRPEINGKVMDENLWKQLLTDMRFEFGSKFSKDTLDSMLNSKHLETNDPINDFIDSHANEYPFEKVKGTIKLWVNCIDTDTGFEGDGNFYGDYVEHFIRKWLVSFFGQYFDQEYRARSEWFLALLGEEHGIGKTNMLLNFLLPEEWSRYLTTAKFDSNDKDFKILMSECILIVDDELDGKAWNEVKGLKSTISLKVVKERRPYARYHSDFQRKCLFAGAGNELGFMRETRNRRIIPVNVKSIDMAELERIDRNALWMEVYWLWKSDFKWWFEAEEDKKMLMDISRGFLRIDSAREAIVHLIKHPENQDDTYWISATEIADRIYDKWKSIRLHSIEVGKRMTEEGFSLKRPGNRAQYGISKSSEILSYNEIW